MEGARRFLAAHKELRKRMLRQLKRRPLQVTQFEEYVKTKKSSDGWTTGSEVSRMLYHLEMSGEVMIVGRDGIKNIWGLPDTYLPNWVKRKELTEEEFELEATQRAVRALGTASSREILLYFPRGRYVNLRKALGTLLEDSSIRQVEVLGIHSKEDRYIHKLDVGLLKSLSEDDWHPRMSLLPPFDNLVNSRRVLQGLFNFSYVHELFFPEEKRKYGYYVMPILWGDRFIGRIDPSFDRTKEQLLIKAVYAEPGAPTGKEASLKIRETIQSLADFIGAREVVYSHRVPLAWKNALN